MFHVIRFPLAWKWQVPQYQLLCLDVKLLKYIKVVIIVIQQDPLPITAGLKAELWEQSPVWGSDCSKDCPCSSALNVCLSIFLHLTLFINEQPFGSRFCSTSWSTTMPSGQRSNTAAPTALAASLRWPEVKAHLYFKPLLHVQWPFEILWVADGTR